MDWCEFILILSFFNKCLEQFMKTSTILAVFILICQIIFNNFSSRNIFSTGTKIQPSPEDISGGHHF